MHIQLEIYGLNDRLFVSHNFSFVTLPYLSLCCVCEAKYAQKAGQLARCVIFAVRSD